MRAPTLALLWTVLAAAMAAPETAPAPDSRIADSIPDRPAGAETGSEFARRTAGLSGRERQRQAVAELTRGNLPGSLRRLVPVRLLLERGGGGAVEGTLWVLPDYLAIGSDADSLRFPLTYPSAVAVAQSFGMLLPTRKMVDAIYDQADHRLAPSPMPPGPSMRSTAYYLRHQETIQRQLAGRAPGLVAGHKKDVVVTRRLFGQRGRIAIYGWHRDRGRPIQPLSLIHGARYADYSHGVRLVHPEVWIGGEPRSVLEVLEDRELGPLLSYEGTIPGVRRLLDAAAVAAESP